MKPLMIPVPRYEQNIYHCGLFICLCTKRDMCMHNIWRATKWIQAVRFRKEIGHFDVAKPPKF
jgi:hypothetical protein